MKAARPAPPPLSTVAPQGSNIRREWVAQPKAETTEEDAATAAVEVSPARSSESEYLAAPFDEEGAPWPVEVSEAGFSALAVAEGAEPARGALPPLDTLTSRLGGDTRTLLEELFRARFVSVKRIQKGWLKE